MNPYYEYFTAMSGGGMQPQSIGDVYEGVHFQRGFGFHNDLWEAQHGSGLASGLAALARVAMPWLQNGLKYLGNAAVTTVADIAKDAIAGEPIRTAAKQRVEQSTTKILEKVPGVLRNMSSAISNKRLVSKRTTDSLSEPFDRDGFSDTDTPTTTPARKKRRILRARPNLRQHQRLLAKYPALRR